MLHMLAAAGVALSIVGQPVQAAGWPSTPPPDRIIIDVATVNGSGCRPGTAAVAVSADNEAFTVTYSEFMAQVGVGALPTDFRKNCQISLKVHVPQGFTYAVAQADYRGFAHLERGANGLERANYYFQGMSPTSFVNHPLNGAMSDDWQFTDKTDIAALVYHPCGEQRNFNINTELRVNAGTSDPKKTTSFIAMDSTDGSINTTYHFHWKTCPR
ncbi:hypothetical protein ALI144C_05630 [Actinosynnema sp. ALI-1.44]|uniref:DUF4360 domain-containing protein n=1 Tax=Actinosynnema sp. ALI-1.44 TaxID=1933779 RepID=UPI00097C7C5A|nr:DUF4360 domain-containing protein [Actinosynnema sp. ALI-1.44]ONI88982.1 hypothetical protein ALI144C_05630 [Actinosynnema sp. ALI-1.44]